MPTRLTSRDFDDVEVVDAHELSADGTTSYRDPETVASTTAATKTVVLSGTPYIVNGEYPVEVGDLVTLTGDAAGDYTVASVVDDLTFTVEETIIDSTGGTATFKYAPGAEQVGVDPTDIPHSTATRLQQMLEDLSAAISAGGITAEEHKVLRQIIHFIDDGPAEGFASGAYKETLPAGSPFPTSEIWWESDSKLKKIVELTTTWSGAFIVTEEWKMYDTDGSTVLATVTDAITYSGAMENERDRTIVVT